NVGIFPSRKTRTLPGMVVERWLGLVAVTWAEKRLYLSEAEGRNLDGSPRYPSRFILDVDPALLEYTAPPRDRLIADAREYIGVMEKYLPEEDEAAAFAPGDRVVHKHFGAGTVQDVDSGKSAYSVLFDSMETPRSISFRTPLTRG
ncbi:MAG: DNA helicase UvrD, partial [Clostridia bacterium]|nr:DNA helicase UvrD [Clostridia bacterium]